MNSLYQVKRGEKSQKKKKKGKANVSYGILNLFVCNARIDAINTVQKLFLSLYLVFSYQLTVTAYKYALKNKKRNAIAVTKAMHWF